MRPYSTAWHDIGHTIYVFIQDTPLQVESDIACILVAGTGLYHIAAAPLPGERFAQLRQHCAPQCNIARVECASREFGRRHQSAVCAARRCRQCPQPPVCLGRPFLAHSILVIADARQAVVSFVMDADGKEAAQLLSLQMGSMNVSKGSNVAPGMAAIGLLVHHKC